MKIITFFIAVCLLTACSSGTNYKKFFSGNKFTGKILPPKDMPADTASFEYKMAKKMIDEMKFEMNFKEDGKVTMSAMGSDNEADWKVSNDTLITTDKSGKKDQFKLGIIEGDKITITQTDEDLSMVLTKAK